MVFHILLAEKIVEIHPMFKNVHEMCRDYFCKEQKPQIRIHTSAADIESERQICVKHREKEHLPGYLETLSVYRKIAMAMLEYSTFLMHGSVIAVDGCAYMITAPSGTGKTARTMLWLKNIPGSDVVNGDKPLLKIKDGQVLACGTPWCGKEGLNTNTMVPLRAIFLLERAEEGEETTVKEITFSEAFIPLLRQTYQPEDPGALRKTLGLIKQLNGKVKIYRYRSALEPETVLKAYDAARP